MTVSGVTITNPDRVVYPELALTKNDVALYFEAAAPLMLPHIRLRPLSLIRCPAGRTGECFFQKHWPPKGGAPVRTRPVAESNDEEQPYAVAERPGDLVALVQHGMMETHMWGSRIDSLERPDRMILDLDPGPGVSWTQVKEGAHEIRELLDGIGLASWVKVSGGKGLHVVVPTERRVEWSIMADFAHAVADRLTRDAPTRYVSKASKAIRNKRIFVDWLRNTRSATSVAPWSARARMGAPVSLPVDWKALDAVKKPDAFSIPMVMEMIRKRPHDPWKDMLKTRQRLTSDMAEALLS